MPSRTCECFSFPNTCVPEHSAMRQCSGLVNSPSTTARKQAMKKKSSKIHVVRLESHSSSSAINHCMLIKYFFQITALVFQWELLVYIGRTNSSVGAILHADEVNEREKRIGEGLEEMCLSIVLFHAFILFYEWIEIDCLYSLGIKKRCLWKSQVCPRVSSGHNIDCNRGQDVSLICLWPERQILKLSV